WRLIDVDGNRLQHVGDGVIATRSTASVRDRLKVLHDELMALLTVHLPTEAAVEQTYVTRNGAATLKLGYARGVALLAPALAGIPVTEYGAKSVKLAVVGTGGAEKPQVQMMGGRVRRSDAPMRRTRWRWRSATRITAPADWPGPQGRGARDRPAQLAGGSAV